MEAKLVTAEEYKTPLYITGIKIWRYIKSVVSNSCNRVSGRLLNVHGRWTTDAAMDDM